MWLTTVFFLAFFPWCCLRLVSKWHRFKLSLAIPVLQLVFPLLTQQQTVAVAGCIKWPVVGRISLIFIVHSSLCGQTSPFLLPNGLFYCHSILLLPPRGIGLSLPYKVISATLHGCSLEGASFLLDVTIQPCVFSARGEWTAVALGKQCYYANACDDLAWGQKYATWCCRFVQNG